MSSKSYSIISSLLLLTSVAALAQSDDILANTATFKPKITLSDVYSEKVVTDNSDPDFTFRDVEANPERISISVTANLTVADVGVIDEDTSVGINVGYFSHSDTLGDAPDYKPNGKKATFPLTMDVDLPNGNTVTKTVGSVVYAWNAKTLTVTVTCSNVDGAGVSDIAASDYVATADSGTTLAIVNDPIDVEVDFGDASGDRRAFLKGTTSTVTKTFGSVADGTDEEYDISSVNIQGSADVTGPTIKGTLPLKPSTLNQIAASGTATDNISDEEVSFDSVTVNGVVDTSATLAISDDDGDGIWNWSITGLQLKKGTNAVILNFSDEEGNVTQVKKSYPVK